jgi:hypothetical protein
MYAMKLTIGRRDEELSRIADALSESQRQVLRAAYEAPSGWVPRDTQYNRDGNEMPICGTTVTSLVRRSLMIRTDRRAKLTERGWAVAAILNGEQR